MHRKLLTVVVGLLLGQSICWGEPAQKNLDQVPSPSAVRAAKFTPVHRAQLPNGMRLLLAEAPEENIVAVEVIIQTGILEEKTNLSGLTRMLSLLIERKLLAMPRVYLALRMWVLRSAPLKSWTIAESP